MRMGGCRAPGRCLHRREQEALLTSRITLVVLASCNRGEGSRTWSREVAVSVRTPPKLPWLTMGIAALAESSEAAGLARRGMARVNTMMKGNWAKINSVQVAVIMSWIWWFKVQQLDQSAGIFPENSAVDTTSVAAT